MNRSIAYAAAALLLCACSDSSFGPGIEGTVTLTGRAWIDLDAAPGFSARDRPASRLALQLLAPGSNAVVATGVADTLGTLIFPEPVPVGTYDLQVDPAYLGDSLTVSQLDSSRITLVAVTQNRAVTVGVTYPLVTVGEARALAPGKRVWIRGRALNNRGSSIDSAVHVAAAETEAIRVVVPLSQGATPGDSVLALGRASTRGGQPVLENGIIVTEATALGDAVPVPTSIAEARSARGGELDAQFIEIGDGVVSGVTPELFVGTTFEVVEGPDVVSVFLPSGSVNVNVADGQPVLRLRGLLVPDPSGPNRWRVIPRFNADVVLGPAPPP